MSLGLTRPRKRLLTPRRSPRPAARHSTRSARGARGTYSPLSEFPERRGAIRRAKLEHFDPLNPTLPSPAYTPLCVARGGLSVRCPSTPEMPRGRKLRPVFRRSAGYCEARADPAPESGSTAAPCCFFTVGWRHWHPRGLSRGPGSSAGASIVFNFLVLRPNHPRTPKSRPRRGDGGTERDRSERPSRLRPSAHVWLARTSLCSTGCEASSLGAGGTTLGRAAQLSRKLLGLRSASPPPERRSGDGARAPRAGRTILADLKAGARAQRLRSSPPLAQPLRPKASEVLPPRSHTVGQTTERLKKKKTPSSTVVLAPLRWDRLRARLVAPRSP